MIGMLLRSLGALCVCLLATAAHPQLKPVLRTSTTTLELYAGQDAPRLVSLRGSAGEPWAVSTSEPLISQVEIEGKPFAVHWRLSVKQSLAINNMVRFVYISSEPKLRLEWEWQARSRSGPIEHRIRIQNQTGREIWLPLQQSFAAVLPASNSETFRHVYVEKGADAPSAEGTHEVEVTGNYAWTGESSTYAHPAKGEPREIIPWSLVERDDPAQSGFYVGLEFSGRTAMVFNRNAKQITVAAGLNPYPETYRTRLQIGETFETPTAFFGALTGGKDGAGNGLRRWVRDVLGNPAAWKDPKYPVVVNNSWGSGMAVDEALALGMIRDSAELGVEMFHMDAGWFRGVGDWYPNPAKFPHGLKPVSDAAHKAGLRFGIWVDWTQAALGTNPGALNVNDPVVKNWLVSDLPSDWKPEEFKGETVDIGAPAAHEWTKKEVHRIVRDYGLDMLEHDGYLVAQGCVRGDHPHAPPDAAGTVISKDSGFRFVNSSNSTDVSYHATRAYYDIQNSLRQSNPNILLEVCNDGGRMVDFGSAAHADYFSITDTYDPLSNRRAFYDTSHVLPAAMLESYVEKWPVPRIENFRYMLRSGMMGWLTIMLDTTKWNEEQHRTAKDEIQFYKTDLRPLIRDATLYHVSPRPDGVHWDAIEYWDPSAGKGAVYVFRGSIEEESSHSFRLNGLDLAKRYRVTFRDHSSEPRIMTGKKLMSSGLPVSLALPNSSEIVLLRETDE